MLRLFINSLTADEKYSLRNRDNFPQPIQMQLSETQTLFLNFFLYSPNLNLFLNQKKNDDHNNLCISEMTHWERRC